MVLSAIPSKRCRVGLGTIMLVFVFFLTFSIGNMCIGVSAELDLPVHNVDTGLDYSTIQKGL